MQPDLHSTDVLIVGAGPAGLSLAGELKRLGVDAMILDHQPSGANTSRACVIHARTLEVLEPLGAVSELLLQGEKVPFFRARDRDRVLLNLDFSGIPSRYCFTLMCAQDHTEQILLGRLEQLGGKVLRPAQLHGFVLESDGIRVDWEWHNERRSIVTRWLIGCDGMNSVIRERAGIPFIGAPYEESFVLADVRMDWPLSREEVTLFFSQDGFMVVSPLPGEQYRIVATVDQAPEAPSMQFVQSLLDSRGPRRRRGMLRDIVWSSRFHIHHRVAASPRKGRVLLCGDAAHVHSPAGGQGMNTGIQDSISLARVLAATLQDGDESRLDVWAADRHEVAKSVVKLTDKMTRMATLKSGFGKAVRNVTIALAGKVPQIRSALAKNLAELP